MNFYKFEAKTIGGETIAMRAFEGKTVVVVNTASKCGLTPQYEGLESLHKKHKDKGLVILGFPCNQFGSQEPGDATQIDEFCQVNYGVSFQMFDKIKVNGKEAHPLFKYLKKKLGGGLLGSSIKWNFTKFLIDKNGTPVKRFSPTTEPEKMEPAIMEVLK